MKALADKTGGRYFRAKDTEELSEIYALLDQLEPIDRDKRYYRPRMELYVWPLALALTLAASLPLLRPLRP
jgi:Ca-activated chloride channel homolog